MFRYYSIKEVIKNGFIMQWEIPAHTDTSSFLPVGSLREDGLFQMVYKIRDEKLRRSLLSGWPRCDLKKKYELGDVSNSMPSNTTPPLQSREYAVD